ncbi:hypothetical protein BgiMline_015553, partial [Biomphalaria glabrata]
ILNSKLNCPQCLEPHPFISYYPSGCNKVKGTAVSMPCVRKRNLLHLLRIPDKVLLKLM